MNIQEDASVSVSVVVVVNRRVVVRVRGGADGRSGQMRWRQSETEQEEREAVRLPLLELPANTR